MGRLRNHKSCNKRQSQNQVLIIRRWPPLVGFTVVGLTLLGSGGLAWLLPQAYAIPPQQIAQAASTVTYPTLFPGSSGESVSRLQATLQLLGFYQGTIDGAYSPDTQAAVTRFQAAAGIPVDGIVGPSTWRKLLPPPEDVSAIAAAPEPTAPEPSATPVNQPAPEPAAPTGPPILRPNAEGGAVAQLQRELQTLGYYDGPIDGIYGDETQRAVMAFQSEQQLEVDAIVGPSTWDALTRALG
ncbi:MAG: peptidoglycan-binding protein [Cyanobacteria bacterium P01_D01_bin.36]